MGKHAGDGITMAVALRPVSLVGDGRMCKVYVVGLGPGDSRCLTAEARSAG
ncbi:MAG: hypothetical protein ACLTYN_03840 [Dysosmobacter welbionis]